MSCGCVVMFKSPWFLISMPAGVGYLSVYSKSDGIVNWRACLDPAAEHVEIKASHVGMAVNARGYRAIAQALTEFREADRGRRRRTASSRPGKTARLRRAA